MNAYELRYLNNPWKYWFAFPMTRTNYRYRAGSKSIETAEAYYVEMWLPGFRRGSLRMFVEDGSLQIEGNHNQHLERLGLGKTALQRSVVLPADVDAQRIDAKYRNGRLLIRMAKQGAILESWQQSSLREYISLGVKHAVDLAKKAWDRLVSVMKHGL